MENKEKETPEETIKRCCDFLSEKHYNNSYCNLPAQDKFILTFEIAEMYHYERLKIELPSDREIIVESRDAAWNGRGITFVEGAKWLRNLLIK